MKKILTLGLLTSLVLSACTMELAIQKTPEKHLNIESNNDPWGNERNFLRMFEVSGSEVFHVRDLLHEKVSIQGNADYGFVIYLHNSGETKITSPRVRLDFPDTARPNDENIVTATITDGESISQTDTLKLVADRSIQLMPLADILGQAAFAYDKDGNAVPLSDLELTGHNDRLEYSVTLEDLPPDQNYTVFLYLTTSADDTA